ncbi:MAG: hypothetical protein AAGE80_16100 [Pseudomonadota bacterium]
MTSTGSLLHRLTAALLAVLLAVQAAAGPAAISARGAPATTGQLLIPICAGGTIQYVLIDLTADSPPVIVTDASASGAEPIPPDIVLEIDCPLTATAVAPSAPGLGGVALLQTQAPILVTRSRLPAPAATAVRPPVRGPPLLS